MNEIILSTAVWSARTFESFVAKLPEIQFKNIILQTKRGENVLHCILENENAEDAERLWNLVNSRLDRDELTNLLFEQNSVYFYSQNVFKHAALLNNHLLIVMLKWLQPEEFRKATSMLFIGYSILLHEVALYCDANVTRAFFDLIAKNCSQEERKKMYQRRNIDGMIPLQLARSNVREEVFQVIRDAYLQTLSPEEYQNIISTEKVWKNKSIKYTS